MFVWGSVGSSCLLSETIIHILQGKKLLIKGLEAKFQVNLPCPIHNNTAESFVWSRINYILMFLIRQPDYFQTWFLYVRDLYIQPKEKLKGVDIFARGHLKITLTVLSIFSKRHFLKTFSLKLWNRKTTFRQWRWRKNQIKTGKLILRKCLWESN